MSASYTEFDDILGPASGGRPARESKRKAPSRDDRRDAALKRLFGAKPEIPAEDLRSGMEPDGSVTVFWLAKTFGLEVSTARKRLADCPGVKRKSSGLTYSIGTAARYLVDPVTSVEEYIKGLRPGDLPENIRASYWDAQLKRQKWEMNARQLWHTVDVMTVLGEAFVSMKSTMDLWAETLERTSGLTDDQRKRLEQMVDALQDELQDALVGMAERRSTPSSASLTEEPEESDYADLL